MPTQTLRVGDTVTFRFAGRTVTGKVIEDRGRIGVGGRQLVAVSITQGLDEHVRVEMPAEQLTLKAA